MKNNTSKCDIFCKFFKLKESKFLILKFMKFCKLKNVENFFFFFIIQIYNGMTRFCSSKKKETGGKSQVIKKEKSK